MLTHATDSGNISDNWCLKTGCDVWFVSVESGRSLVVGGLTPIIHISEGRVDELSEVSCLFGDVHQHRDGVVVTTVQVQKSFW